MLTISVFEIKLEDKEDILNIIKLKTNAITNVNYLYQFLRAHHDIMFWFKSYEYELMKPKIIYCIKLCFVFLCDG